MDISNQTREVVLRERKVFKINVGDMLAAFLWKHMTDPTCTQIDKKEKRIVYEIRTELPQLVHTAFGNNVKSTEVLTLEKNGFISRSSGELPGASFKAFMTYTQDTENSEECNVQIDVELDWKVNSSSLIRDALKIFVVQKTKNYLNELPAALENYKSKK